MPVKKESLFERLSQINVSKYTEKKGMFTYLSWSWAVSELKKVSPEAYWIIHEWGTEGNEKPYQQTESGYFVKVTVIAEGIEMTQVHPVLDNKNNAIKSPNAFQINTSIMRCLTKAISLHGLGLYIYAGEDLPPGESETTPVYAEGFGNDPSAYSENETQDKADHKNYSVEMKAEIMKDLKAANWETERNMLVGFGKHSDLNWSETPSGYLEWLYKNANKETYKTRAGFELDYRNINELED